MPSGPSASDGLPPGYEFVTTLGSGAAGQVVLARQRSLDRLVAVKTLHTGRHDARATRRLVREGQAIVALRHPAIVEVFELSTDEDGNPALIMEYVDGGDLSSRLGTHALSGPAALLLLADIAAGIDYAHAHGVVHRDLKPGNILLTDAGHAKVADFGIARLTSPAAYRTLGAQTLGTPGYAAPEQLDRPDDERPESDWYSFAAVAYSILTGASPFRSDSIAGVLEAQRRSQPIDPRSIVPAFDSHAAEALIAGLSRDAASRLAPSSLVAALAAVDADAWTAVLATRPDRSGADRGGQTLTAGSDHSTAPAAGQVIQRPPTPAVDATTTWPSVVPPRALPSARRRRLNTWLVVAVACGAGVLIGFALVVLAGMR